MGSKMGLKHPIKANHKGKPQVIAGRKVAGF